MTLQRVLIAAVILLALAVAVLVGVLIGGRGGQEVSQKEATKNQQSETQPETQPATQPETTERDEKKKNTPSKKVPTGPQPVAVEVGEEATLYDRKAIVNDTYRDYVYPRNSPKPKAGYEFVIMNITITNTSSQPITVSPSEFKSEDSNGVRYNAEPSTQHENPITYSTITPNGELTGNLVIEVPQGEPVVKLVYTPNG